MVAHLSTAVLRCVDTCHTLPYLGVTCGLLVWRWVSRCFYIVQVQKDIASWFTNRIIILYIMKSRRLKDEELMGRGLVDNESTSSSHLICCIGADICIVSFSTPIVYSLFPEVTPHPGPLSTHLRCQKLHNRKRLSPRSKELQLSQDESVIYNLTRFWTFAWRYVREHPCSLKDLHIPSRLPLTM